jgi:predicted PurR-regulated permease PerM
MTEPKPEKTRSTSPRWGNTTKLVVALTFVAILAGLLIRFRVIIGPALIAFILAYLLYPLANFLHRRVRMSWRLAATLVFLLLLIIFVGLLTLGGLAIVDQVQSLIKFLQTQIRNLPALIADLSTKEIEIGPFTFDLATLDLTSLTNQLLGLVQPLLSNTAVVIGSIATGAATTIGWALFSLLVGYFILSASGGERASFIRFKIPGSGEDLKRIQVELNLIWNAFLRGQIIIFTITVFIYTALLGSLGVGFYLGLAFIAGLARFVPYIGPAIAWITYGLVALFGSSTVFGLEPFPYALLVVGLAWLTDVVMDNFVVPRLMGDALKVHPAAVMVAAIVSASLFGIIGVVLAAPVLATAKLVLTYVFRKMFDLDPWEGVEERISERQMPFSLAKLQELGYWILCQLKKLWKWILKTGKLAIPLLKNLYWRSRSFFQRKTMNDINKPQMLNPGGGSDERHDGTKNRHDC